VTKSSRARDALQNADTNFAQATGRDSAARSKRGRRALRKRVGAVAKTNHFGADSRVLRRDAPLDAPLTALFAKKIFAR
jgi:hypothetical protein